MHRNPSRRASRIGFESMTMTYPRQSPNHGYTRDRVESMGPVCLTNQAPMLIERPVNKQSAPDQVLLGHRPPPPAVIAVVAVIAHREISVRWNCECLPWIRQIITPGRVTAVRKFRGHDSAKSSTLGKLPVDVEERRIDSQSVTRN